MSKPDDIPQDVWDVARAAFGAPRVAIELDDIARAIMAAKAEEREACELIAQDWIGGAEYIAAAIRKRGEVNSAHKISETEV